MSLIYLLSSLPMLSLDAPPAIDPKTFVATCREQLDDSAVSAVEALLKGQSLPHPFVEAWNDKEAILRNAVARQRARAAGADAARWQRPTRGCDNQIEAGVDDAFEEPDPLAKEKSLDKVRWLIAEELQGPDPLSLNVAFAYAVKLAITSRWHALDAARGQQAFDTFTQIPITLGAGD
jgi:hypothetical protein